MTVAQEIKERFPDWPPVNEFDHYRMNQFVQILDRRMLGIEESLIDIQLTSTGALGSDTFAPIVHTHGLAEIVDWDTGAISLDGGGFFTGLRTEVLLEDISDVTPGAGNEQILKYSNTAFGGSGGWVLDDITTISSSFASLIDTQFTALADEDLVQYDAGSSRWVNVGGASLPFVRRAGDIMGGDLQFLTLDELQFGNSSEASLSWNGASMIHEQIVGNWELRLGGSELALRAIANGAAESYYDGLLAQLTAPFGIRVQDTVGSNPGIGFNDDVGTQVAAIQRIGGAGFVIDAEVIGDPVRLQGTATGPLTRTLAEFFPNGSFDLYSLGNIVLDGFDNGVTILNGAGTFGPQLEFAETGLSRTALIWTDQSTDDALNILNATTNALVRLQGNNGAVTMLELDPNAANAHTFYHGTSPSMTIGDAGVAIQDSLTGNPTVPGSNHLTAYNIRNNDNTLPIASLGYFTGTNDELWMWQVKEEAPFVIVNTNGLGVNIEAARFDPLGGATLNYLDVRTVETTERGFDVFDSNTGASVDDPRVRLKNQAGGNLANFSSFDGDVNLDNRTIGVGNDLFIRTSFVTENDENQIVARAGGAVEQAFAGTQRTGTTSVGFEVFGTSLRLDNGGNDTDTAIFGWNSHGGFGIAGEDSLATYDFLITQRTNTGGFEANWAAADRGGAFYLMFNDNPGFHTTAGGAAVQAPVGDSPQLDWEEDDATLNFSILHDSIASEIIARIANGVDPFVIDDGTNVAARFLPSGAQSLRFGGASVFGTTPTGAEVNSDAAATDTTMDWLDNGSLVFRLFHDESASEIIARMQNAGDDYVIDDGTNVAARFIPNGIQTFSESNDEKARTATDANGAWEINKGGQWDEVLAGPINVKAGDTSRTNNTISDDPDLTDNVAANRKYQVELFLEIENASATPDFQFQFTVPTSATFDGIADHVDQDNTNNGILGVNDAAAETITLQAAEPKYVRIKGTLVVAGTAGTFALGWAQATTDGLNATILRETSWMTLVDVS